MTRPNPNGEPLSKVLDDALEQYGPGIADVSARFVADPRELPNDYNAGHPIVIKNGRAAYNEGTRK